MSKGGTPLGRSTIAVILGSGAMLLATAGILVLHGAMFALTASQRDPSPATAYLWSGTALAASTAWATNVLYRALSEPLTRGRWLVVVLGCASAAVTLGLWVTFWSGH